METILFMKFNPTARKREIYLKITSQPLLLVTNGRSQRKNYIILRKRRTAKKFLEKFMAISCITNFVKESIFHLTSALENLFFIA